MAKNTTKSVAAKKAMANRGTFESKNTNYHDPIHYKVVAAVAPYSVASAKAATVWGDTLVESVPPAYALRYRTLKGDLDAAMLTSDYDLCAELAASLIKALKAMNQKAREDGFKPPQVNGHIVEWGGKIYCFLASGDLGAVRRERPSWAVYDLKDVCAFLKAHTGSLMAAVVNKFPDARVVGVRLYDDKIPFGHD